MSLVAESSRLPHHEKLNHNNFPTWHTLTVAAFKGKGLYPVVKGDSLCPVLVPASAAAGATAGEKAAHEILHAAWTAKDHAAAYLIIGTIEINLLVHIKPDLTAKENWDIICALFKIQKSDISTVLDRANLYKITYEEGADMAEHCDSMLFRINRLVERGLTFEDIDIANLLITSLPDQHPTWETIKINLLNIPEATRSSALVRSKLIEELRRTNGSSASSSAQALAAGYSNASKPRNRVADRSRDTCNACGQRGHWANDRKFHPSVGGSGGGHGSGGSGNRRGGRGGKSNSRGGGGGSAPKERHVSLMAEVADSDGIALVTTTGTPVLDSGCSNHVRRNKDSFTSLTPFPLPYPALIIADGGSTPILGQGTSTLRLQTKDGVVSASLSNSIYVPTAKYDLISASALDKAGASITTRNGLAIIRFDGQVFATATLQSDGLYHMDLAPPSTTPLIPLAFTAKPTAQPISLWHRRLGHVSYSAIEELRRKNMVEGLDITSNDRPSICPPCIEGKQIRTPFPKQSFTRAKAPLGLWHIDLHGPMPVQSHGKKRYILAIKDDASRIEFGAGIAKKSDALAVVKEIRTREELQTGRKLLAIRTDGGGEFNSDAWNTFFRETGIIHQTTSPYSPQQNGVVERSNRTNLDMIRCLLKEAGLPQQDWLEAYKFTLHIRNRMPTQALEGMVPFEAYYGVKPDLSDIRVFGCLAYAKDVSDHTKGLDSRTNRVIFLGWMEENNEQSKSYRVRDVSSRRVFKARDIVFDESPRREGIYDSFPSAVNPTPIPAPTTPAPAPAPAPVLALPTPPPSLVVPIASPTPVTFPLITPSIPTPDLAPIPDPAPKVVEARQPGSRIRKAVVPFVPDTSSTRRPNKPRDEDQARASLAQFFALVTSSPALDLDSDLTTHLGEFEYTRSFYGLKTSLQEFVTPETYAEAISCAEGDLWKKAMDEEIASLDAMGTWATVPRPEGRVPVKSKWVFKKKLDAEGAVTRYKARLVAKGFSQIPGLDFTDTFAPVTKYTTIRTFLSLAAANDWDIGQLDVKNAYLNGELKEDIYMELPEGYGGNGKFAHLVAKLAKAIYGLKQAGERWYEKVFELLVSLGFHRSEADHCLFHRLSKDGTIVLIIVYVDDFLIASNNATAIVNVKQDCAIRYNLTDMGDASFIVGIQIERNRFQRTIRLNQTSYIHSIIAKFGMDNCAAVSTPVALGVKLTKDQCPTSEDDILEMRGVPYLQLLGSIAYAAIGTRPDLAYAIGVLSQFGANPGSAHWTALKRLIRYLKGTADLGLVLGGLDDVVVTGWSDSDWAADLDSRRSIAGFTFDIAGGMVSWSSKKQPTVALSTAEAEYMAMAHASKEAIWLRTLLSEIGFPQESPSTIHVDNQGAIALANNPVHHARTKHIDIRHHFIRERIQSQEIELVYCPTDQMIADVLTKGLAKPKHEGFVSDLGLDGPLEREC